jgi:hypothetical protein
MPSGSKNQGLVLRALERERERVREPEAGFATFRRGQGKGIGGHRVDNRDGPAGSRPV